MIIKPFSPKRFYHEVLTYGLIALIAFPAYAADKPQTLTGTISLGSGRFALNTQDGKVIAFMGKGGNKVFEKCRNGDRCEITGTVVYNTRMPLFVSVLRVKKLGHASATVKPVTPNPQPKAEHTDKAAMPATTKAEQQPVSEEVPPEEQQAPVDSPLLPDTPELPTVQPASPQ